MLKGIIIGIVLLAVMAYTYFALNRQKNKAEKREREKEARGKKRSIDKNKQ